MPGMADAGLRAEPDALAAGCSIPGGTLLGGVASRNLDRAGVTALGGGGAVGPQLRGITYVLRSSAGDSRNPNGSDPPANRWRAGTVRLGVGWRINPAGGVAGWRERLRDARPVPRCRAGAAGVV